jgi:apolipoprotein N-acyltransferase
MARIGLLTASGILFFLGNVGFDLWPLSLVALVPALWALDPVHQPPLSRLRLLLACAWMGLVINAGGYHWLVETLEVYSGFPWALCVLLSAVLWTYQGGQVALFLWLFTRARTRGHGAVLAAAAAFAAAELLYPMLFEAYFANSLHMLPVAIQIADLGGPMMVTALMAATNGALYLALRAWQQSDLKGARMPVAVVAGLWMATLAYGGYRIHEVDDRAAKADKQTIGLVQANMGMFSKRNEIMEGLRRHQDQSRELEEKFDVDLLVWPESAVMYTIPDRIKNVRRMVLGEVSTPTLFGGLARRSRFQRPQRFNTAFLTDAEGNITGTYDKTFLLAFGEYIPFGETFPKLYGYSPNSGHFTAGAHMRPLKFGDYRLAVLICYEDILPGFVRQAVASGRPHLLINMTNDAWFGDTIEPWQHLALAKFRAVEHHRALVRATNSGVSAVVDPVGRVLVTSGVFEQAALHAEVPMLDKQTPYAYVGDWPGWLGLLGILWMAFGPPSKAGRAGKAGKPAAASAATAA